MSNSSQQDGQSKLKKGCVWVGGIFAGLFVLGLIVGPEPSEDQSNSTEPTDPVMEQTTRDDEVAIAASMRDEEGRLTGPQSNAVRTARSYLQMSGFSRDGLVEQLSSPYGDGYEVTDAEVAVDSLDVNWNEQAARSAQQYLDMTGFSCNGLIEQLSSDAGDQYTAEQARYGAQQAGAC